MTYSVMETQKEEFSNTVDDNELRKFNWSLLLSQFALFFVGIINLYSATHVHEIESKLPITQGIWFGVGLALSLVILFFHYSIFSRTAYFLYFLNLLLLVAVLFVGKKGGGSARWIGFGGFRLQPSEFMKISVVLALAKYFENDRTVGGYGIKELIVPSLIALVPAILVIAQPDLGTGLIILMVAFLIFLFNKIKMKTLIGLFAIGASLAPIVYTYALKPYQQKRILSFLDPASDPSGSGWNSRQSQIAIGSGKIFGKGFFESTQSRLNFLPEHHTDFIFSVFSEEHGFLGSLFLFSLYIIFFMNCFQVVSQSNDKFGIITAFGLTMIMFLHVAINLGMVTGSLPVVGVPLPYMSYGGSILISTMICVAILVNIHNKKYMF